MAQTFSQIIVFQVKPDRVDEFEAMAKELAAAQRALPGCLGVRYTKRFYTFDGVEPGLPPRPLTKIVKCVKYYASLTFDGPESCGAATGLLLKTYWKPMTPFLIAPFDLQNGFDIE